MRPNTLVEVRTPRNGLVKRGRVVTKHNTHSGLWIEISPVGENNRIIKDAPTFRSRPVCVTAVK